MPFIFRLSRNRALFFSVLWLTAIFIALGERLPQPWPDEMLYADIVRNWVETKVLGIPLFAGYFEGIESHLHFYPPLYFLASGVFFHFVPLTLLTLRFFSYASLVTGAVLLVGTVVRPWGRQFVVPAMLLFVFDPTFLRGALVGRMDAFAILMILASLTSVHSSETSTGRRALVLLTLSGFFAGLAFLTHPMAWSAPFAISLYFVVRLFQRQAKWRDFIVFALAVLLTVLPYFIWLYFDWTFFTQQFVSQVGRKQLLAPRSLWVTLSRYDGFFNAYGVAKLFGIVVALSGWVGLVQYTGRESRGAKFLIIHSMLVALALYSGETWYPIYYLPTSLVGFLWLVAHRQSVWFPKLTQITVLGFLIGTIGIGFKLREKSWTDYCAEVNQRAKPDEAIFLAATPDPYFCFPHRPPKLAQFVPNAVRVPRAKAESVLNEFNVILMGRGPVGDATIDYINENSHLFDFTSTVAGGYPLTIARRKAPGPKK